MNKYYKSCPFPKPESSRKKLLSNGYKGKMNRICAICGERGAERHELFGGANRQTSIREGFQIDLCRTHHIAFHTKDEEWMPVVLEYQRNAQHMFELKLVDGGVSPENARAVWMHMIGRNYIWENEEKESSQP